MEGPFKGQLTLILPNADQHTLETVAALINANHAQRPKHLWLETQPGESFNWKNIERLKSQFNITLQVREPEDLPPQHIYDDPMVGIVWMVPERYAEMLQKAEFIKWATAPGYGFEIQAKRVKFIPSDYEKDQVWHG